MIKNPRHSEISGLRGAWTLPLLVLASTLETYDFVAYSFVAAAIGKNFFPAKEPISSMTLAFAVFGAGFLARPVGAAAIGFIGDRRGRRAATALSILVVGLGALLMGIAPTYEKIGLAAPSLITFARLVQGFGYGGGAGTIMMFAVETAPESKRGLFGSLSQIGSAMGALGGSAVSGATAWMLSDAQFETWGWRLPILIGVAVIPLSFLVRIKTVEPLTFLVQANKVADPVSIRNSLWPVLQAIGIVALWTSGTYVFFGFLPNFNSAYLHLSSRAALLSNTLGICAMAILIPAFGVLSDRIGRRGILLAVSLALLALPYYLFNLILLKPSLASVIPVQLLLGALMAAPFGVCPATLAEIFPTSHRTTLGSMSYGLAVAVFGGFAPWLSAWIINLTQKPTAPAFIVMAAACVTGLTSLTLSESAHRSLR